MSAPSVHGGRATHTLSGTGRRTPLLCLVHQIGLLYPRPTTHGHAHEVRGVVLRAEMPHDQRHRKFESLPGLRWLHVPHVQTTHTGTDRVEMVLTWLV